MNNSAHASHFFARLRRETAKFYVLWWTWRPDTISFFWTKIQAFRIQPRKKFIKIWQLNDVEQERKKWQLKQRTNLTL